MFETIPVKYKISYPHSCSMLINHPRRYTATILMSIKQVKKYNTNNLKTKTN